MIELFEQTRTMDQTAWLVNDASRIDFQRGVQVHMQSELLKPTIRPITLVQQRTTHTNTNAQRRVESLKFHIVSCWTQKHGRPDEAHPKTLVVPA